MKAIKMVWFWLTRYMVAVEWDGMRKVHWAKTEREAREEFYVRLRRMGVQRALSRLKVHDGERIRVLQERFRALRGPGGLPADKAFYDSLSGDT